MRGVLLVAVVLALLQSASGAQIQSVTFWNDSACTVPVNVATTYNQTETSQWPGINPASVYDSENAPCANVNLGAIQSGTYTCLSNVTGIGGLLVLEYGVPDCAGPPAVQYVFLGQPNATSCVQGELEVFSNGAPTSYPLYATVVCNNLTALPSAPSSSSGISGSAAGSSSAATTSSAISSSGAGVGSTSSTGSSSSGSNSANTGLSISSVTSSSSSASGNNTSPNGAAAKVSATAALFVAAVLALFVSV